jgi:hypothetical protein
MAAQSILPELLPKLEAYIEERMVQWAAQSVDRRTPTLPSTKEGKVNVRELTLELGLKRSQEQHFFKHVELRATVNAAATTQGLAPISSREEIDANDAALGKRMKKANADLGDLQRVCAEQAAQIEVMRSRIASLEEKLRIRDDTGMVFRGGL